MVLILMKFRGKLLFEPRWILPTCILYKTGNFVNWRNSVNWPSTISISHFTGLENSKWEIFHSWILDSGKSEGYHIKGIAFIGFGLDMAWGFER